VAGAWEDAMKFPRGWVRATVLGGLVLGLTASEGRPQQKTIPGQIPMPGSVDPFGSNQDIKAKGEPPFNDPERRQVKLRDEERQKRLVADTDKLLQLATQLRDDVAKTDRHMLSLDVIKRADEIEKLAHGVKDRMKG
jgi:hypothetical protein